MNGSGFDFLEGVMRTGASVARNYFEAKVAVAEAANERDLQQAQMRLASARNRLLEQKNRNDLILGRMQIDAQERIHKENQETERYKIVTAQNGEKYKLDVTTGAMVKVAELEAQSRENIAKTGADANVKVAETQADANVKVAETQGGAAKDVAEIGADANVKVAETQADAAVAVAETRADAVLKAAEIEAEIARNIAEFGNDARQGKFDEKFEARFLQGYGGKVAVSPEAARHFMSVRSSVRQSDVYELLNSSQLAVHRALQLYGDGATPADDIALMNIFQRAIDPGVSVREGDVELQRATESVMSQFDLARQRLSEGVALSSELRVNLLNTLVNLANTDYRVLLPRLEQTVNSDITMNSELSMAGYHARDMFYMAPQSFDGTVTEVDEATGALTLQAGVSGGQSGVSGGQSGVSGGQSGVSGGQNGAVPGVQNGAVGSDGRLESQGVAPGATGSDTPTGARNKIPQLVARAKEHLARGYSVDVVLNSLKNRLAESVGDAAERMEIYNAVAGQLRAAGNKQGADAGGGAPAASEHPEAVQAVQRLAEQYLKLKPDATRGDLRRHLRTKMDWAKVNVVPVKRGALINEILNGLLPVGETE